MGIPRLAFSTTSSFTEVWSDKGSGADTDGTFYRTNPPDGFFSIGDYGQSNYKEPSGTVLVIQAIDDDPNNPLLKPPTGFAQIVNDKGSGADQDGSFWYPLPPAGYVSIGSVVQQGYNPPTIQNYRCLRLDQVEKGSNGGLIYADHGSGADEDMSIFRLDVTNVIWAQKGYQDPIGPFYQPKGL